MGPGFEQVLAHIAGDKLIGTVVVRVQWSDVFADQEGALLQAHIDDQLGGRGRAEHHGHHSHHPDHACCVDKRRCSSRRGSVRESVKFEGSTRNKTRPSRHPSQMVPPP